jgi:methanogenic corrinoid protein MtbC1
MLNNLVNAIVEMREDEACELVEELLESGTDVNEILSGCQQAMGIVGERFEIQEYFLPELIMSGEILKSITSIIGPRLKDTSAKSKGLGVVLIGTVAGDIHDIGKDIVIFMLEVSGFKVYDLGVDVAIETFVDKVKEVNPDIVALSGLLTITVNVMKETVEAIAAAGYRDKVKIMVGGGAINEDIKIYAGADGYTESAVEAVALVKKWMGVA